MKPAGLGWKEHDFKETPSLRSEHSCCADITGRRCFIFGGRVRGGMNNEIWSMNFGKLSAGWSHLIPDNPGPSPRKKSGLCFWRGPGHMKNPYERLYVHGGLTRGRKDPVGDLWYFDFGTNRWEPTDDEKIKKPCPRDGHSLVRLKGMLYLFGGHSTEIEFLNDLWTYDPMKNLWTEIITSKMRPEARCDHAFTTMNGQLLISGGKGKKGGLSDCWLFDTGCGWNLCAVHELSSKISPRWGGGVCYFKGTLIQFGGWNGRSCCGEIDVIDTTNCGYKGAPKRRSSQVRRWIYYRIDIKKSVKPVARTSHSLISCGNHILLFGGRDIKHRLNDTWTITFNAIKRHIKANSSLPRRSKLYYLAQNRPMDAKDFNFISILGKGSFGLVKLTQCKRTREYFAIKVLKKTRLIQTKQVKHTLWEKDILSSIAHPFIVNLETYFKDHLHLYLTMQFVQGGDFFSFIKKTGLLEIAHCAFYISQIVLVFKYLHKNNIVYRDLKPENLLIASNGYFKLTDFGFAKRLEANEKTSTLYCGSPEYIAPEVLRKLNYGYPVDWWALGILLYEIFCGRPPYDGANRDEIFAGILKADFSYPDEANVPARGKSLINVLLHQDPEHRLGKNVAAVMTHDFFKDVSFSMIKQRQIRAPYIPPLDGPADTSHFEEFEEDLDDEKDPPLSFKDLQLFKDF